MGVIFGNDWYQRQNKMCILQFTLFTASAPTPIQSISCNIRGYVCFAYIVPCEEDLKYFFTGPSP